ncbi:unnamed protein product [Prorocentrum cordatum]|nr:unnamed protein product [Polarella glacialis]
MWEAKLEPDVISYSAGISACEKGEQWQRALALLSEMWEAKLEPNVISYSAGISACAKCETGTRRHQLQRWDQRVREMRAVAAGACAAERVAGGEAGVQCSQLQPCDRRSAPQTRCDRLVGHTAEEQRLSERWSVAAGSGAAERDVGGEAGAQLSYSAGVSACAKGEQWQRALALLSELREAKLESNAASYSPAIVALLRRRDATG